MSKQKKEKELLDQVEAKTREKQDSGESNYSFLDSFSAWIDNGGDKLIGFVVVVILAIGAYGLVTTKVFSTKSVSTESPIQTTTMPPLSVNDPVETAPEPIIVIEYVDRITYFEPMLVSAGQDEPVPVIDSMSVCSPTGLLMQWVESAQNYVYVHNIGEGQATTVSCTPMMKEAGSYDAQMLIEHFEKSILPSTIESTEELRVPFFFTPDTLPEELKNKISPESREKFFKFQPEAVEDVDDEVKAVVSQVW